MNHIRSIFAPGLALLAIVLNITTAYAGSTTTLKSLIDKTHFHGIAVHPIDPARFYLATHHGFFLVSADGDAKQLSDNVNDYMGFTPHPTDQSVFFASGHPASGGNTGFIQSTDGGRTWKRLSSGYGGPVDFHQMDVSRADPKLIFGVFRGLQTSEDGGNTWTMTAQAPPGLIDLAASAKDTQTLYAATKQGLLISTNRGKTWQPAHLNRSPASMVQAAGDGGVYAFILGLGLLRSPDDSMSWAPLNNEFGDSYLLHLAVDSNYPDILYAITNKNEILTSQNAGITWKIIK